jgi:N-alpha-acetyl-L-2,4-diaminobutyrate deacetylase
MTGNPISPTVPFDQDGIHHGFLRLPYSRDDSAWGSVMIPITVVRSGDGPTALLTGGNHGDEYEGPIALQELAATLNPKDIRGRVIIVPALNHPAFLAGTRTSPVDQGNLNRSFPGKPDGTVTQKIAHYVDTVLIPMADIVLDYHSGGKTLDFVPFAAAHVLENKDQQAACVAAMQAFNAPYSATMLEIDSVGMLDTAVEQKGKVFVTTELGGGGTATARSIGIAKKGARNLLKHAGILSGEQELSPTVTLDMPDGECFVFCEQGGMIEPVMRFGRRRSRKETSLHGSGRYGAHWRRSDRVPGQTIWHPDGPSFSRAGEDGRLPGSRREGGLAPIVGTHSTERPHALYSAACAISGNKPAKPSDDASQIPRSVISPVTSRLGVTSNAGFPPDVPSGVTCTTPIAPSSDFPWIWVVSRSERSSIGISDTPSLTLQSIVGEGRAT